MQHRRAIFTDPVHRVLDFGNDEFTEAFSGVVDHEAFQRLRRISQLGLASYVFPGATHTRFLHSLGASYLARRVVAHLIANAENERAQEIRNFEYISRSPRWCTISVMGPFPTPWAAVEENPALSLTELARSTYGSIATASRVKKDRALWLASQGSPELAP